MTILTSPPTSVPQPMKGMNWEPSPSNYTSNNPPPPQYGDTDFANDDFIALWDVDSNGVGRYDLQTMQSLGVNTIKMYNWSVPAPNGYWMRNHTGFLSKAASLGLSVIVPISNFYTGTAYNNRTNNGNPGGPPSSTDLEEWIYYILQEIYQNSDPEPVIMWAIGNEYDNSNVGAYGYCEAQDIATIASYIVAAEQRLGVSVGNVLPVTSPVTTAITPVNTSIACGSPPSEGMAVCAIQALIQALTSALGPDFVSQRFIASINSYQIGQQLVDYYNEFPGFLPGTPFFYGELGFSAQSGDSTQAQNVYSQFTTTMAQAAESSYFYGSCGFEFSDELWKGPTGSSETMFGIYTFDTSKTPQSSNEGNHAPVWGAQYPVDYLTERPAGGCLQAALSNGSPPSDCS